MTVAYLGGTFDIIHPGHTRLFQWADRRFDRVIVSINTDAFVKRYKGSYPALSQDERMEVIAGMVGVDDVIFNVGDEDSRIAIRSLDPIPTHVVNGMDWTIERLKKQMMLDDHFLRFWNIEIVIAPVPQPIHSSDIKKRILNA